MASTRAPPTARCRRARRSRCRGSAARRTPPRATPSCAGARAARHPDPRERPQQHVGEVQAERVQRRDDPDDGQRRSHLVAPASIRLAAWRSAGLAAAMPPTRTARSGATCRDRLRHRRAQPRRSRLGDADQRRRDRCDRPPPPAQSPRPRERLATSSPSSPPGRRRHTSVAKPAERFAGAARARRPPALPARHAAAAYPCGIPAGPAAPTDLDPSRGSSVGDQRAHAGSAAAPIARSDAFATARGTAPATRASSQRLGRLPESAAGQGCGRPRAALRDARSSSACISGGAARAWHMSPSDAACAARTGHRRSPNPAMARSSSPVDRK